MIELTEDQFHVVWSLWGKGKTHCLWKNSLLRNIMPRDRFMTTMDQLISLGLVSLIDGLYSLTPKAITSMSNNQLTKLNKWEEHDEHTTSM